MKSIAKYIVLGLILAFPFNAGAGINTQTFTADGTKCLEAYTNVGYNDNYLATVSAKGTWGSGTITWKISYDEGSTYEPMKDLVGTAMTSTADDSFNVPLGKAGSSQDNPYICAVLSGSTNPSLTFRVMDNN